MSEPAAEPRAWVGGRAEPAGALIGHLEGRVRSYGKERAVVAVSGGVDSAVVLAVAARALGAARVLAVTAVSPSFPAGELDQARSVVAAAGTAHRVIETREVEREGYARNDGLRCFHCKAELYGVLERIASEGAAGGAVVLSGANADDALDLRPGIAAGERLGVRSPLLELGVGKAAVRDAARLLRLPVAEKPALACLSSRVAFGIRITPDLLARIDRAEGHVRALGYDAVRVRHFGRTATIEVAPDLVASLAADPALPALLSTLRSMGWSHVQLDPRGYRSGSMNATLAARPALKGPGWPGSPAPGRSRGEVAPESGPTG